MAYRFPALFESLIIRSYHSYSPGELSWKWRNPGSLFSRPLPLSWKRSSGRVRSFTLSAVVIAILQNLGAMSPSVQRLVIHSLQPFAVSALYLLFQSLSDHPIYFTVLGFLVVVGLIMIGRSYLSELSHDNLNNIHPVIHNHRAGKKTNSLMNPDKVLSAPDGREEKKEGGEGVHNGHVARIDFPRGQWDSDSSSDSAPKARGMTQEAEEEEMAEEEEEAFWDSDSDELSRERSCSSFPSLTPPAPQLSGSSFSQPVVPGEDESSENGYSGSGWNERKRNYTQDEPSNADIEAFAMSNSSRQWSSSHSSDSSRAERRYFPK
jgi:hypothetical protein